VKQRSYISNLQNFDLIVTDKPVLLTVTSIDLNIIKFRKS